MRLITWSLQTCSGYLGQTSDGFGITRLEENSAQRPNSGYLGHRQDNGVVRIDRVGTNEHPLIFAWKCPFDHAPGSLVYCFNDRKASALEGGVAGCLLLTNQHELPTPCNWIKTPSLDRDCSEAPECAWIEVGARLPFIGGP